MPGGGGEGLRPRRGNPEVLDVVAPAARIALAEEAAHRAAHVAGKGDEAEEVDHLVVGGLCNLGFKQSVTAVAPSPAEPLRHGYILLGGTLDEK